MTNTTPTGPAAAAVPVELGDRFTRQQIITGLRDLADFLEANPGVPVGEYGETFLVFTPSTVDDASAVAMVDQTAALLDTRPWDDRHSGGHYSAYKSFGPIAYKLVHIPRAR